MELRAGDMFLVIVFWTGGGVLVQVPLAVLELGEAAAKPDLAGGKHAEIPCCPIDGKSRELVDVFNCRC